MILGIGCWLVGNAARTGGTGVVGPLTELPLGGLCDVAVDAEDRIYCGSAFYGRVQRYGRDGEFQRGWSVDAAGGTFRLRVDPRQRVEAATARNDMLHTFDEDGRPLSSVRRPEAFRQFARVEGPTTSAGGRLRVEGWVRPRVVEVVSDGSERTVVRSPFRLQLLAAPFVAMLYLTAGIALHLVADVRDPNSRLRRSGTRFRQLPRTAVDVRSRLDEWS